MNSILESYVLYPNTDKDLWSKFEDNLSNLDADKILSEHSDTLPNYSSDDFRDRDRYVFPDTMDNYYKTLTDGLFEIFQSFIQDVEFPSSTADFKLQLDSSASFLTFNYTNTLERLYHIDKEHILYIHNSAFDDSGQIILGHGINPEKFKEVKKQPPDEIDPEDYEKWYEDNDDYDYSYTTGKETLMKYFEATFKPTQQILAKHSSFFRDLNNIKEIYILGHSLLTIDLPYFESIVQNMNPNASWKVSFYTNSEYDSHLATLTSIGIDKTKILMFKLEDIQQKNIQLKINF